MPQLRTYDVFICHDWEYSDEYSRAVNLISAQPYFRWNNLSVPEHDPLANGEKLEYELRNQIRPAHILLVLAGMYTAHSTWMDWELSFARRIGKPIIGVVPWGNERVPVNVQRAASEIVGWNGASLVAAIRHHAEPE